jgi:hypothetical protein
MASKLIRESFGDNMQFEEMKAEGFMSYDTNDN